MNTIRVINDHPHVICGRYDGRDYVFRPGKGEDIPPEAAAHIFGFGSDDKTSALNRLGQLPPAGDVAKAMEFFDKIRFLEGKVVFEDDSQEENAQLRASPGPMAKESGDDRSHVRSSGGAEAGKPASASSNTLKLPK
jgi:hypothetical protein